VVPDRHELVVREKWIVRPKQAADVGGVEDRGVEIGVVADRHRQQQVRLGHRDQAAPHPFVFLRPLLGAPPEKVARPVPEGRPVRPTERHEPVQRGSGAGPAGFERCALQKALGVSPGTIENLVPNGGAHVGSALPSRPRRIRGPVGAGPEYAERQVLDWEIGSRAVRGFDPAGPSRIVRRIGRHRPSFQAARSPANPRSALRRNRIQRPWQTCAGPRGGPRRPPGMIPTRSRPP